MSQQYINIGATPNDGLGDPIRTAFQKTNENFSQLFPLANVIAISGNGISVTGNISGNYFIGNGSQLTGISNVDLSNVSGNIIPSANVTYSLGNTTNWWANAWFGANTLYIGGIPLGVTGNVLTADGNAIVTTSNTGNVAVGNITTAGTLSVGGITLSGNLIVGAGPTLTIDPNGSGGADGNVVIAGNLTVQGTTTTVNSNTITTNDLTINMANNAVNSTAANNGGIEVGPVGSPYATLLYNTAANVWVSSLGISSVGNLSTGANVAVAGNLLTGGVVSATGNITGSYILGNGSQLTGITAGGVTSLNGQTGAITDTTFAAVGSYVTGRPANDTLYIVNDTVSGSILYSICPRATWYGSGYSVPNVFSDDALPVLVGLGTWQCMSAAYGDPPGNIGYAGLWVRIS